MYYAYVLTLLSKNCHIHTAWGLRCSFFGKCKFEGLSDGTGNNEGSTFFMHIREWRVCVVFEVECHTGTSGTKTINTMVKRKMSLSKKVILILLGVCFCFSVLGNTIISFERLTDNNASKLSQDSYVIKEYDFWKDKYVDRVYQVTRYDDGTTKVSDGEGNWMIFKTEYNQNEFTGEKSAIPVNGKQYCGFNAAKETTLISAYRLLPNGYLLEVNNGVMRMSYPPFSISYCLNDIKPSSKIWYEWVSEDNFKTSFNSIFSKAKIKSMNGSELIDCSSISFKDLSGNTIKGGYFDKESKVMYYVGNKNTWGNLSTSCPNGVVGLIHPYNLNNDNPFGDLYDKLSKAESDKANAVAALDEKKQNEYDRRKINGEINRIRKTYAQKKASLSRHNFQEYSRNIKALEEAEKKELAPYLQKMRSLRESLSNTTQKRRVETSMPSTNIVQDVVLIYGLPSDTIIKYIANDKVIEINYKNGDYIKISKLQQGSVYECNMHRPNGIWKVVLNDKMKPVSEFVYTSGPFKGLIYKDDFYYSQYGQCLTVQDMITPEMMKQPYYDGTYDPRLYQPSKQRWVHVRGKGTIKEFEEEKEAAIAKVENTKRQQQQNAIYQVYCKKYGKSNVDEILNNKRIKLDMPFSVIKALCNCSIISEGDGYQLYEVWFSGYSYDLENKKIQPHKVAYSAFANKWTIRVVNGVVKKIYHD